ncbi:MAG: APC family permease [Acetobacteraceae bacterium]|nr:APC family permease [Acetobacteraceae bacterium]
MSLSIMRLLTGRPIADQEAEGRKLGVVTGVPAMGLDALGSASYGPEAALAVLAGTGAAALGFIGPIMLAIVALLGILWFSYWQTIAAYPNNGGSYIVAHENLGTYAGVLAAAALMVDYILNVAVGISAGVGALTSAIPVLHEFTVWICLGILLLITLLNLRGTRESGLAWAGPTYVFVFSLGFIIVWGVAKVALAGGHAQPVVAPPPLQQGTNVVALWLVLRAFASGCTAMTGVEAISNGVSAFGEPRVRYAHGTLSTVVLVLGLLLLGIGYLAHTFGILAMDQTKPDYQSVISQLVGAIYGRGWFYYVTIASVLAVLCLSANTSFVDFPRMCSLVARDDFLPRTFAVPGRRLVMSSSILFLALCSGSLLAIFGGITDRLIPLFAVGAFLAFTMSQAGMAAHWWHALHRDRQGQQNSPSGSGIRGQAVRAKLVINGMGAIATGIALAVILAAKFLEGAWLTVVVIPSTVLLLRSIHKYYDRVDRHELLEGSFRRIDVRDGPPPIVLVPIERWDRLSRKAIHYALLLSQDVRALHITNLQGPEGEGEETSLRAEWEEFVVQPARDAGLRPPSLQFVYSPYRSVLAPLLRAIENAGERSPDQRTLVVLPELVEGRWWGTLLHTHRERRLRARLLRHGGPRVAVICVPWQLGTAGPEEALAEEEPAVGLA